MEDTIKAIGVLYASMETRSVQMKADGKKLAEGLIQLEEDQKELAGQKERVKSIVNIMEAKERADEATQTARKETLAIAEKKENLFKKRHNCIGRIIRGFLLGTFILQ